MIDPVLVSHLHVLTAGVGANDETSVQDGLGALISDLRSTIASYCGLQLRIVDHDWPVTLIDFVGAPSGVPTDEPAAEPATSLRIDLVLLTEGADPANAIIFWATTPGAFVDLAADLDHALGVRPPTDHRAHPGSDGHRPRVVLDADLPPASRRSGLTGLTELVTINRAIGFLIGQGERPEDARRSIHRGSAAAGVDLPTFAARLLRR